MNQFFEIPFTYRYDLCLHNIPHVELERATRTSNRCEKPLKWAKWSMWPTTAQTETWAWCQDTSSHRPSWMLEGAKTPTLMYPYNTQLFKRKINVCLQESLTLLVGLKAALSYLVTAQPSSQTQRLQKTVWERLSYHSWQWSFVDCILSWHDLY